MSMDWNQLLCTERLGRASKPRPHDPARSEFRRDSDRLTFSTAFRRLQDKTQVFPLADNDYVRTRLTHSLEVSSVGRSLGARVGAVIAELPFPPPTAIPILGSFITPALLWLYSGYIPGMPIFSGSLTIAMGSLFT